MSECNELHEAAMNISDLLASTLLGSQRSIYVWEHRSLEWLSLQLKRDPTTSINAWTYDRVKEFERGEPVKLGNWPV